MMAEDDSSLMGMGMKHSRFVRIRPLAALLLALAMLCAALPAGCADVPAAAQDTPAPTATPAPTPRPTSYLGEAEADALLLAMDELLLLRARGNRIWLYEAPDLAAPRENARNLSTSAAYSEVIVLEEVAGTDEDGAPTPFYRVRTAFDGTEGYMPVQQTRESVLAAEGVAGFALMQRPGCALYRAPSLQSDVLARADYQAVRVLGTVRDFAFVVTQQERYGFMDPAQLRMTTRDEIEQYLAAGTVAHAQEPFRPEAFAAAVEARAGEAAASAEELIVEELTRAGLYFSPGYYGHFVKPLGDVQLYPLGLYQAPVYNSLLFRLWNSAGNLVQYRGGETEWAHIGDYADVQRGDLLFFAEYGAADLAVVPTYEVVLRGPDSGYVTACGVALGDDRMLTVQEGRAVIVERVSESPLIAYFDCARRIHPSVVDEAAHLCETLISAMYDRLGTPYSNARRTGDASYDCSGIVCWGLRSAGVRRFLRDDELQMWETTASGLANIERLYRGEEEIAFHKLNERLRAVEDIARLERGDVVFLYNERGSRIGHVMVCLGGGNVIHSTTVTELYEGTLVAGFRPELQELYACARRFSIPAAEDDAPAVKDEEPAAEGEEPAAEGEEPAAEGDAPAADDTAPAEDEEPAADDTAPAEDEEPAAEGDAPAAGDDAPARTGP